MSLIKKIEDPHVMYYQDQRNKKKYTRIAGGIGWPGIRPGFLVVVAEEFQLTPFLPNMIHILEEFESDDIDVLLKRCLELNEKYLSEYWHASDKDKASMEYVSLFNRELTRKVRVWPAIEFGLSLNIVRRRMQRENETLILGEQGQLLRSYLLEIPQDAVINGKHEMYPAVSALGAVVSAFDLFKAVNETGQDEKEEDFDPLRFGMKKR